MTTMTTMNIELIESASNEIAEYSQTEAALAELRQRMANVTYDVTTTKGMAVAKADRAEVRSLRTNLEAKRKEIKAPALSHCKLIDDEAKRITAELLKLETPIDEQIKAEENRKEAERAAREAAEKARLTTIHGRIASITTYVALAHECRTAARVQSLIDKLQAMRIGITEAEFEELLGEAQSAYVNTNVRLMEIHAVKFAEEAERERIKAEQQAAAEKLAEERAAFAAQQTAAKAEADRLQAERLAQIAKEVEQQAAQRKAEQAEVERVTRANREAARLEAERVAADRARMAQEAAAQQAAIAAQRAELEAQRQAFEAQRQAAHEAKLEQEQRDAEHAAEKEAAEQLTTVQAAWLAAVEAERNRTAVSQVVLANGPTCSLDTPWFPCENTSPEPDRGEAPEFIPSPPCCAADGICTDACSNTPGICTDACLNGLAPAWEPSDADVMWVAIRACAQDFGWTTAQSAARLKSINWTI